MEDQLNYNLIIYSIEQFIIFIFINLSSYVIDYFMMDHSVLRKWIVLYTEMECNHW